MHQDVDVIVVGAGPVGLTAALLLAEKDTRVALVDPLSAPSDLPRAISLADESFRILQGLGLDEALKAQTYLDTGARYFGLKGRLLAESKPAPSRSGHPAKSQFDQPVLEQLLWDRAVEHPMIQMLSAHRVTAIAQDASGAGVTVAPEDGSETFQLRGAWLLAADGGRSFAREELGVELEGSTQEERWVVIDLLDVPGEREPFAEFHGNGDRPLVLVPGLDGRLRLEYMMLPEDDADEMVRPERIREMVLPFHPEARSEDIRRAVVYVAHRRLASTYRVGRCFLVGDAAHLMPPFSGQGLNAGLRDAANIVWKLQAVLDGVGTDRLLDTYESERRTHAKKMIRVSHLTGSVVMARGVAAVARDVLFRAARLLPPVYAYLSGMRFITPPRHVDGAVVEPTAEVAPELRAMVGAPLSQPFAEAPDGGRSLLDDHLGNGWSLVVLGADDELSLAPFWASATVRRLVPATARATSPDQLVDLTGALTGALADPAVRLERPHVLVVRPDRYVAAVFTPESEDVAIKGLRPYVDLAHTLENR
ncbi:FAD-dependent monooxygenase [Nocardioides gilvus]|uniref:FAD-dependent monooxygenase n=1 Tax=Nocardioides gilvus TaxID=1735589 RepID=UPI000D74E90F|nr:FAD-dependent monooxygenase [Nocardioides gilvus]